MLRVRRWVAAYGWIVELLVLGLIEVHSADSLIRVGGIKQRSILALLEAVDLTAIALAQQGRAEQAARLKGAVDRERDNCGLVIYPSDAVLRKTAMRHARSILEDDWDTVLEQGRTMTLEEAIGFAAAEINAGPGVHADPTRVDDDAAASA